MNGLLQPGVSAMEKKKTVQLECVTEKHNQIQSLGSPP